jgi:hypothetical protein
MNILKRHSFWKAVLTGLQIPASTMQVVIIESEGNLNWNIAIAVFQGLIATGNLLIKDDNRNDIIDIVEAPQVDITISATDSTQVNVKQETKPSTDV